MENVANWQLYWKPNADNFHTSRRFVFKSSLNNTQQQALGEIDRPAFEFNVLEAYLSRNIGEFAKQEPSFIIHAAPDSQQSDPNLIKIIEGHFQAILYNTKRQQFEQNLFSDIQSGGFSAFKVETAYQNAETFNQDIKWNKCFDPTLCGWDPVAREGHKGDGDFAYEIFPLTEASLHALEPDIDFKSIIPFTFGGYTWSYKYGNTKIVLLCNYYQKEKTRKKLCYLADNTSMLESEYKDLLQWYIDTNQTAQPPVCIKTRKTELTTIKNIRLIQNEILSETKTIYTELPIIFVNGNSKVLRDGGDGSSMTEFTRPYFYQAMDCQKLKNIAGQALGNELEGLVQHKFIAPLEGIPEQYTEAYKKPQKANTLVYKSFMEDGITPIEAPREVQRPPIPPEITQTFMGADQSIQNILGAYNPQPENPTQLSGVAIAEAALQSSAAGEPYINNYLISLNQAAKLTMDLMPKIYFNPRSLPIINKQREKTHVPVNGFANSPISMKFNSAAMNVTIEAGANFEVQKNQSLQMMTMLAQSFPAFNQLINSAGLTVLLDNLSFRGVDQLADMAKEMMKQAEQQKNQPKPPDPNTLKAMDIQMRGQHNQAMQQIDMINAQNDQAKTQSDLQIAQIEAHTDLVRAATEREVETAKLHLDATKIAHDHEGSLHDIHMAEKGHELEIHKHIHEREKARKEHESGKTREKRKKD